MKLWILKTVLMMGFILILVCLALYGLTVAAIVANTTAVGGLLVLLSDIFVVSLGASMLLDRFFKDKQKCVKKSCCSSFSASQS